MAQLAIKGHPTRGKEVIEILEMLGGENKYKLNGCNIECAYYKRNGVIRNTTIVGFNNIKLLTLEEFLEKFPYKIGDKVSSKHLKNYEVSKMEWESVNNRVIYKLQGMGWYSADELQPYKEETMNKAVFDANVQCCDIMNHLIKKETIEEQKKDYEEWFQINYLEFENNDDTWADEVEVNLGKDYEIQIRGDKTFIVKKQLQYPKTYAECCRIIVAKQDRHYYYTKKDKEQDYPNEIRILDQLDHLRMLIICRDAYWKIAGEQMGLGKPWGPDWSNLSVTSHDFIKINNGRFIYSSRVLVFPTSEICDIFYENFKGLIESCKELL